MQLFDEIIVDNFAGGGGASTGISEAIGRSVDIAINHDPAAIAMHKANHPDTEHYCEDVWAVDPRKAVKGRLVGLAWFSPDCKHFSKAKGGKPVEKKIRGLAWVVVRWAATVRPRVIILENVEEFKTWGPLLTNGRPDPDKKGRTFMAFVHATQRLGYKAEWRELRACDYGAPTIRKRLFVIFRNDGRSIVWPKPTHGHPDSTAVKRGKLKPWRTAAEIIDWSLPCPSIFERKKPLAENTLRRIARGIMRFVVDNPNPFIIKFQQNSIGQTLNEPIHTVMAGAPRFGLVTPHITKFRTGATGHEMDDPLHTITSGAGSKRPAGAAHALGMVTAFLSKYHGLKSDTDVRGQVPDEALRTLDTSNRYGLISAYVSKYYAGESRSTESSLDDGLHTVTARNTHALVTSHLVKIKGTNSGQGLDEPAHTVTSKNYLGEIRVTIHLVKLKGDNTGQQVIEPLHTITAGGNHFGEVRAFLLKYYGTATGQPIDEPLATVTTKDRIGLVTIHDQDYQIVDIGMRMLRPRELYNAQSFPPDYIIDKDCDGKPFTQADQVAMCGNSVPPVFARALIAANTPELCQASNSEERMGQNA